MGLSAGSAASLVITRVTTCCVRVTCISGGTFYTTGSAIAGIETKIRLTPVCDDPVTIPIIFLAGHPARTVLATDRTVAYRRGTDCTAAPAVAHIRIQVLADAVAQGIGFQAITQNAFASLAFLAFRTPVVTAPAVPATGQ